jgi:hypothetical protein
MKTHCDRLMEHMRQGLSFDSFAGTLNQPVSVIRQWAKDHPEFENARKIGESMALKFWEELGRALAGGKLKGNAIVWIFTMKNRFKWTDELKQTITTSDGPKLEDLVEKLRELRRE